MSADRDSRFPDDPDDDYEGDEPRRSIFSAAWFRVLIVLLAIGVVGAVAIPYVLDVVQPPVEPPRVATPPPTVPATPAPATPPPTTAMPAAPAPAPPVTPPPAAPVKPKESVATPDPKGAAPPAPKMPPPERAKSAEPSPRPPKPRVAAEPRVATAQKSAPARPKAVAAGGDWFVQVGAFKEQETARRVATRLRDQNYPVEESVKRAGGAAPAPRPAPARRAPSAPAGPDRYDVLVSGGAAADINSKLAAKGLASEPAAEGVRIRPSLPLRDAVALSKDLGADGFKVQVRRAVGATPEAAPAPAAPRPSGGGDGLTLYRVRVGGYPDRATAQGVARELTDKGFQPFIAKGRE